jgi:hypothetical protein
MLRVTSTSSAPSSPVTSPLSALASAQTCMRSVAWKKADRFSL